MTPDDVIYTVGNIIYESANAEEIFNKSYEYGRKYFEDTEKDSNYVTVCLNGAYAAFMRGYETKKVCETICAFLCEGIPLMAFDEVREENLKNAIAQYGVKKFHSAECANILHFSYMNGTKGYIKANSEKARRCLEKAAALGKNGSQVELAHQLQQEGKAYDAGYWYAQAASCGNSNAEAILKSNYSYNKRQQKWTKRM